MKPSPVPDTHAEHLPFWPLPRDIIIAPARAFRIIAVTTARRPAWLPAYALIFVSGLIATALIAPAFLHLATVLYPAGAGAPRTPAARADANRLLLLQIAVQQCVIMPLVMIGLTATTVTVVSRFKGRATPYAAYFALMANCLVPSALGTVLSALAVRLRDPNSFHDWKAFALALPDNLALFANAKNEREVLFLNQFDIFNLWTYLLLAYGIVALTAVRLTTALGIAFALDVCLALLF